MKNFLDFLRKIKYKLLDYLAILNFIKEQRNKKNNETIKVGFVCQYIPSWNKCKSIYEKMKEDSRFSVYILCLPSEIEGHVLKNPDSLENDTYSYMKEQGYEVINTLIGKNQWLDLKELKLDYIFHTRPYNSYLPKEYTSGEVSKYTKICLLLYAMSLTKGELSIILKRDFMRHVYCFFAETKMTQVVHKKQFWLAHKLGLVKSLNHGMPALEEIVRNKGETSKIWSFSHNDFRVMWTPRWSTNPALGGSNFFVYKDALLKYARENEDVDLLIRPHPLTFQNFIKTGEMTEQEVITYKNVIEEAKNICLDEEKEYVSTMWNSSVLVSDYSGMIPEYFVTGKPVVFCASNFTFEPAEHFARMLEGCYVVYNQEELFACLEQLKEGKDALQKERKLIIDELFGDTLTNSTNLIVEELAKKSRLNEEKYGKKRMG